MCHSRYKNTQFCPINIATASLFTDRFGFLYYLTQKGKAESTAVTPVLCLA